MAIEFMPKVLTNKIMRFEFMINECVPNNFLRNEDYAISCYAKQNCDVKISALKGRQDMLKY